jgi:hypothetical protein
LIKESFAFQNPRNHQNFNNKQNFIILAPESAPMDTQPPIQQPEVVETPRTRRSSRSRTKSPEPVTKAPQQAEPVLSTLIEEEPEQVAQPTNTESQYEKIIDEMDVDENNAQDDVNEDELLAEEPEESAEQQKQSETAAEVPESEEKPAAEGEEARGVKRRSDSPSKGNNTPKKRQRLPPPNIEDFVNTEDEPELDESAVQLSWCKF